MAARRLRPQLDQGFAALGRGVARFPWGVIALAVLAVAGLAAGLPQVTIDTSNESFLHDDDPILERYKRFEAEWGRNDLIVVGIEAGNVFGPGVVGQIDGLTAALREKVPHLNEIDSLINARDVWADGDTLHVEDLLGRPVPTDKTVLERKGREALNDPALTGLIVNEAGTTTVAIIELNAFKAAGGASAGGGDNAGFGGEAAGFGGAEAGFGGTIGQGNRTRLSQADVSEAVATVRAVVANHQDGPAELYVAGSPSVIETIKTRMQSDMALYLGLSLVIAMVVLALLFRRVSAVVLPIAVVLSAVAAIIGLQGHLGQPITLPMTMAPSFLLAVGVATTVHLLAQFYRGLDRDGLSRRVALEQALGRAGLPMTMAGLTTAGGLLAFATADLAPIQQLGLYVPLGLVLILALSFTLLTALLVVLPIQPRRAGRDHLAGLDRGLAALGGWAVGHHRGVLGVSAVLLALAVWGVSQLDYGHNPLVWLPENDPVRQATERLDSALAGSVQLAVVVDTGEAGGLKDPALLRGLDRLARDLEEGGAAGVAVGKVFALPTLVKQTHQVLNEDRAEAYTIPENRELLAQELLLFENAGPEELADVADSRYQKALFSIQLPWRDSLVYLDASREIEERFNAVVGDKADVSVSGVMTLFTGALAATMDATATSYGLAIAVIAGLMMVVVGSVRLGLVAMIPNLLPIGLVMAAMGPLGIPLDLFTMLVGTIALGLAVDDTLHFMHHFRHRLDAGDGVEAAVRQTLATMGRPILVTTVVIALAFAAFLLGSLNNLVYLGGLTAAAVVLALIANLIVGPALMAVLYRRRSAEAPTAKEAVSHDG